MAKRISNKVKNNRKQRTETEQSNKTKKLDTWQIIIAIIGGILGIILTIITLYNLFKGPTATFNDVPSQYMVQRNGEMIEQPYPLNFTDLTEYKKQYSVTEDCITSLLVSNNSDHQYEITKFSFYATNIEKDYSPYFEGSLDCDENNTLFLNLHNDGWGFAFNVKIELTDKSGILSEYFAPEDLIWSANSFLPDESKTIPLLTNDDLLVYPDTDINIDGIITITCDGHTYVLDEYMSFEITPEGLTMYGGGDDSILAYGIFIDTDNSTYTFSENVSEPINANSNINLPICFYPNMSCDMTFYIELEIFTGTKTRTIRTPKKNMHFRVSHAASEYNNYQNNNFEYFPNETYVSYPFTEKIATENKNFY